MEKIRKSYIEINTYWDEKTKTWTWTKNMGVIMLTQWKLTNKIAEELVSAETDTNKRLEIIDYIYADNLEEVWENYLRKEYLKN